MLKLRPYARVCGIFTAVSLIGQYAANVISVCLSNKGQMVSFRVFKALFIASMNFLFGLLLIVSCAVPFQSKLKQRIQKHW